MSSNEIFEELFVLRIGENYLEDPQKGLKVIYHHCQVAQCNNIRSAINLHFWNLGIFLYEDFLENADIPSQNIIEPKLFRQHYESWLEI
jgi:hypothetical protein